MPLDYSVRAGKVLVAIRDSEQRVLFSGYSPANYKLFVFVVSAALAGLAGMLYVPQVGIITPAQIGVLPSLEMVIWVAVGGRGTFAGAVFGAIGVNLGRSVLTNYFPELWPFFLGGLFVAVVLLFPRGWSGIIRKLKERSDSCECRHCLQEEELSMTDRGSIIYLEGVIVDYDGFKALNNLNFIVNYNELRVVIGPTAPARPRCSTSSAERRSPRPAG